MIKENSLGHPIHHTEEGIKNFWNWFGKSTTVDEKGRPIVHFHGTHSNIENFTPNKSLGGAIYATPEPKYAGNFAYAKEANIIPVYIKSENPHPKIFGTEYESRMEKLKTKGHDSFKVRDSITDPNVNIGVFDPTHIKSIFNNGKFGDSHSISESSDVKSSNLYNFNTWKKNAKLNGMTITNRGPIAGTLKGQRVDAWHADHPDDETQGGIFYKGHPFNYGTLDHKKELKEGVVLVDFKEYLVEWNEEKMILTEVFDKPYEMMDMTDTFGHMIKHQYGDRVSDIKVHAVPEAEGMMFSFHKDGAMEIHHSPIDPSSTGKMVGATPNPRFIASAMKMGKDHIDNGGKVRIVTSQHTLPTFTSLGNKIAKRYDWKIEHKPIEDQNFYGAQHFPGVKLSAMEISKN